MSTPKLFSTVPPAVFLGQLFNSRDTVHLAHLQTTSFAEHKALNFLYEELLDLTDSLIETYFGLLDKRLNIKIPGSDYVNPKAHVKHMMDYISSNRSSLGEYSQIQNIVDEILALYNKTFYLLTLS